MDFRNEVRTRLTEKVLSLSQDEVTSIEKSIFNWTIEYAENNSIVKTWLDKMCDKKTIRPLRLRFALQNFYKWLRIFNKLPSL